MLVFGVFWEKGERAAPPLWWTTLIKCSTHGLSTLFLALILKSFSILLILVVTVLLSRVTSTSPLFCESFGRIVQSNKREGEGAEWWSEWKGENSHSGPKDFYISPGGASFCCCFFCFNNKFFSKSLKLLKEESKFNLVLFLSHIIQLVRSKMNESMMVPAAPTHTASSIIQPECYTGHLTHRGLGGWEQDFARDLHGGSLVMLLTLESWSKGSSMQTFHRSRSKKSFVLFLSETMKSLS